MTVKPATVASIETRKTFSYRGAPKIWGNRYHLANITSLTTTTFQEIADAITAHEQGLFASNVTIVEALGYNAGSDIPLFTKTYNLPGTITGAQLPLATGDSAMVLRFGTTQRTVKNHPIYLYKYFHGVISDFATSADNINPAQKAALDGWGASLVSGVSFGGGVGTFVLAGPYGAVAQNHLVLDHVRHRDFPA